MKHVRFIYTDMIKRHRNSYFEKIKNDDVKLFFAHHKMNHFTDRFVERYSAELTDFDKFLTVFFDMLYARREYFLNNSSIEITFKYFDYNVVMRFTDSTRDSIITGKSKDKICTLLTIIKA